MYICIYVCIYINACIYIDGLELKGFKSNF